jgi:carbonic anhydrase
MLAHNQQFVASGGFAAFASPPADVRCVIVSCMDSRLTHLLPAALNIKQGEAKIVKTAGAIVSHPFGGIMRSVIVALYELRASEVFIVGHDDCGMRALDPAKTMEKMLAAGVPADRLSVLKSAGIDVPRWLAGFDSLDASVLGGVATVRSHPLIPPNVLVHGLIINPTTGAIRHAREP